MAWIGHVRFGRRLCCVLGHTVPGMPDDDDEAFRVEALGGGNRVVKERATADRVHHLGS